MNIERLKLWRKIISEFLKVISGFLCFVAFIMSKVLIQYYHVKLGIECMVTRLLAHFLNQFMGLLSKEVCLTLIRVTSLPRRMHSFRAYVPESNS